MSSIGDEDIDDTGATGDARIDGLLGQYHWSFYARDVMSFSITDSYNDYEDSREGLIDDYPDSNAEDVFAMPADMVRGITAAAGEFRNILNFRFGIDQNDQATSRVRYGITDFSNEDKDAPAYAYMPDDEDGITDIDTQNWMSGDVFFNEDDFTNVNPVVGSYEYHTILHETGHAMGLKHGHESDEFDNDFVRAALPTQWDSMEFSVMTYRSFIGAPVDSYKNPQGHYAQTLMMLDIAALQSMYGADFTTQSGDTTYSWNPTDGSYLINGVSQWTPLADVVFLTIWDGGGVDTYDFSNYGTDINLDLAPGGFVDLNTQIAQLEVKKGVVTHESRGNVFNALLYQNDLVSLIENAKTGSGDDTLSGNVANNRLDASAGDDRLVGLAGDDVLIGGRGQDTLVGGLGHDLAGYTDASGVNVAIARQGAARLGAWNVTGVVEGAGDSLSGIEGFMFGEGADRVSVRGSPTVDLYGQGGDDTLIGGDGAVLLVGGRGDDRLETGDGIFTIYGGDAVYDAIAGITRSVDGKTSLDALVVDRATDPDGYQIYTDDAAGRTFYNFDGSTAYGIERVIFTGGAGADVLYGGIGNDVFDGRGGSNLFEGDKGNDRASGSGTFRGEDGNDTLTGGGADDYLDGGEGDDLLFGGDGVDRLYGNGGDDEINTGDGGDLGVEGGAGNDTIRGGADDDDLNGGLDKDSLEGAGGDDFLTGGAGDDTLDGGAGDDELIANGGAVKAVGGTGEDRLSIDRTGSAKDVSFFLNGKVGSDGSSSTGVEKLIYAGGSGKDVVSGGADTDDIHGGGGADRLVGGGGRDFLYGDAGNDTLFGGAGRDDLTGGGGRDRFIFARASEADQIQDFDGAPAGGQDVVDLTDFGFASFRAFKAAVTISGGATAFIAFDSGQELTLYGVAAKSLDAADFLF